VLWELTHVVFEHPGLLVERGDTAPAVCLTCSDEGRLAEVRATGPDGQAEVVVGGQVERVDISLVGPVGSGDLVLVHGGVALTSIGEGGE
jgi:hydrogenase maturation factor